MNLILNKISNVAAAKITSAAALAIAAGFILAAPASAQTQAAPACPAGYWQFDTAYSNSKGEVHSAERQSAKAIAGRHGGQAQDWKLGALCMRTANGDVWIFEAPAAGNKSASR